jgi:hypothetical protein
MNLLVEASTKDSARTARVKPDKPLKLARLRAAKRMWPNAGVLQTFECSMGVLLHFVTACFELCGLHSRDLTQREIFLAGISKQLGNHRLQPFSPGICHRA